MNIRVVFLLSLAAACLCGCATTKGHPEATKDLSAYKHLLKDPRNGTWHTVDIPAWPGLPDIHWYDRINPVWWLGNCDEPYPPTWYEPSNSLRTVQWYFRNPCANFSRYVIGVADKDTHRSGRYPIMVSNPNGGWNFAVTRWRFIVLPFTDYENSFFKFYIGWRERGNFGIKLNLSPRKLWRTMSASNMSAPEPRARTEMCGRFFIVDRETRS